MEIKSFSFFSKYIFYYKKKSKYKMDYELFLLQIKGF